MWNRCVTVFKEQRMAAAEKKKQSMKVLSAQQGTLSQLSMLDYQAIMNIFVLEKIDFLGTNETYSKDNKKKESKQYNVFGKDPV